MSLFGEGKFLKQFFLMQWLVSYLFDVSSQLFRKICEKSHIINLGLTNKIAPGDGELELEYQNEIISKLADEDIHDISIINGCMLYPSKSMSYIYGADESIAFNQYKDHCLRNMF